MRWPLQLAGHVSELWCIHCWWHSVHGIAGPWLPQLQDVDWEVQVRAAQQGAARTKTPQALVDLVVSTGAAHDHLLLQFSHGQLFNLYTQLEQIQAQLDTLI